ncbi:MAG: iron-sulfur cluster assembly scaffold protein [Candidatus Doudnabacteria bacterium]|nr:iron-sulfur cluster assembly scaffold protein [Candidatus Doudnabacteria bacterium]
MNIYQQDILDHYHHPHNQGVLVGATHRFTVENLSCGDKVTVYLVVESERIIKAGFEAEGCVISIASASKLTDELVGKSVKEVENMQPEYMLELLGIELSSSRLKCAHISLQAAQKALAPETFDQTGVESQIMDAGESVAG